MSDITFKCVGCGSVLVAPGEIVGQDIRCDQCGVKQAVPSVAEAQAEEPVLAAQNIETPNIDFFCEDCGSSLSAPAQFVGEDVRCDKCDKKQTVPSSSIVQSVPVAATQPKAVAPVPVALPQTPIAQAAVKEIVIQPNPPSKGLSLPKTKNAAAPTSIGGKKSVKKGTTTKQRRAQKGTTTTQIRAQNLNTTVIAPKKNSLVKLVVVFLIFAGVGFGAKIYFEKGNQEADRLARAEKLRELEYEKRIAWDTVKELCEAAITNQKGYESALSTVNEYIANNTESDFLPQAKGFVESINTAQESSNNVADQETQRKIATVVDRLKAKAANLIALKDYDSAILIFEDYSGVYAAETQSQRDDEVSAINQIVNDMIAKEARLKQAKWLAKRNDFVYGICDGMINNKSYAGLKSFLSSSDVSSFPELKTIVSDYVKIKNDIINKYQKLKGKVTKLTVKGKTKSFKIIGCDKDHISAGIKLGSKIITTKIHLKDILVADRVAGLTGRSDEAIALYCVVVNMSAGKKSSAVSSLDYVDILKNGLSRALGIEVEVEEMEDVVENEFVNDVAAAPVTETSNTEIMEDPVENDDELEELEELEELVEF